MVSCPIRQLHGLNKAAAAQIAVASSDRNTAAIHPDVLPGMTSLRGRVCSGLLRTRTLDQPWLEFSGFVMMASWMCHDEQAM